MREGSLEAPTRHAIAWDDPDFTDRAKTEAEMHRIFDICHTCRRCFNLCDAFPRLFDLIDNSESGELDTVATTDYQKVADACTLCDMCFMTKCPYVPPHEFNVDFPHTMLRYRAVELREGRIPLQQRELVKTDEALGAAGRSHGAGLRPQGAPLCDLLCQLQQSQHRRGDPRRLRAQRCRDGGALPTLLWHAAARARRPCCRCSLGEPGRRFPRPVD